MEISDVGNQISFLHARDPSIIAARRQIYSDVRVNLGGLLEETGSDSKKESDHIRVYLRIKPGSKSQDIYKIGDKVLECCVPPESQALRNVKDNMMLIKKFTFTKIFGPSCKQTELFDDVVREKVLSFINGRNSTIMTYGASGSGKTYTIVGTETEPGLIPRALEYLFRSLPVLSKEPCVKPNPLGDVVRIDRTTAENEIEARLSLLRSTLNQADRNQHVRTYSNMQQRLSHEKVAQLDRSTNVSLSVWISFAEIYNEYVYDLLQTEPARDRQREKLRLGQNRNGQTYIKNLKHINVSSGIEAYQILQYGLHNLNYASTRINSHSSRSHCIFTIKLVQMSDANVGCVSCFNFCDLAGSERLKQTLNAGTRLKESNCINNSLLVLGRCIKIIRNLQRTCEAKRQVPFRESKLTQLFQSALSGKEDIAMVVNMNSNRDVFDESHHVLNFSAIVKDIVTELKPKPTKVSRPTRFTTYMQQNGYRSTTVASMAQAEESTDIDKLLRIIDMLQVEVVALKKEVVDVEMSTRSEICTKYKEWFDDNDTKWKTRCTETETKYMQRLKAKDEEIRKLKMRDVDDVEPSQKKQKVINLDDSRIEDLEVEIDELKEEKNDLEAQLNLMRIKHSNDLDIEKKRRDEMELTLKSAVDDYNELTERCNEFKNENLLLVSKVQILEEKYQEMNDYLSNVSVRHETGKDDDETEEDIQYRARVTYSADELSSIV